MTNSPVLVLDPLFFLHRCGRLIRSQKKKKSSCEVVKQQEQKSPKITKADRFAKQTLKEECNANKTARRQRNAVTTFLAQS